MPTFALPSEHVLWYLVVGALLIMIAAGGSLLKRLPVSTAMICVVLGFAFGPMGAGLIRLDPIGDSGFLELLTEAAVIVSLFTAGLKLRLPLRNRFWWVPFRLAVLSMVLTVGLIACAAQWLLDLPWGAAILLGGVLAPTDPVLASDVQVQSPWSPDRLRFSLTAEAGLNDGTAFPFVLLGLGLLGARELGPGGFRWVSLDLIWAVAAGLAIGGLLGTAVGRLILYLRRVHREGLGPDEFLALGLIALAYGTALAVEAYGFLAVFAAGLALRRIEVAEAGSRTAPQIAPILTDESKEDLATHEEKAPEYMAHAVLSFNEQLDRIGEVTVVLLVGGMLAMYPLPSGALWLIPLVLLIIRPLSVLVGLVGSNTNRVERGLMAWFGIRGIGSVYYMSYAIQHGLAPELAEPLVAVTMMTVAVSVMVHGGSVTPLINRYANREGGPAEV